jgi:TldD protein
MAFQVTNPQGDMTQSPGSEGDPVWNAALRQALESPSARDGCVVFLEDRQDASVALDSGADRPSVVYSRACGVAVQDSDGHLRFRAEPEVDDVERLIRLDDATRGAGSPPVERRSLPAAVPLPVPAATRMIGILVDATQKLQSRAKIEARWVGFEQRIHSGQAGRGVVADRRQGRRVRLQADLTHRGRAGRAVAEAVLRSDSVDDVGPVLERLAAEVAARVDARLAAEKLPSGERRIVFGPGVGGVLMHEVVGHALEADTVLGRASWLAGSAAEPFQGSSQVLVVDDPRRGRAAWRLDDEGEPARATALLSRGRPAGWLHDRASARRAGRTPTGHGRRASFRDPVRPRMGCTFLATGRNGPGEALQGVEDGIYVRRMEAASTDTRIGRAVFRVTDADRILNGRLVAPLAPHVMCVEGREALSSVDCVADDLAFDVCIGSCLHHGQPLSISVGAPTFRIGLTSVLF